MINFNPTTDLMIERVVSVPAEKIFDAWTTPEKLMPWFCPRPWKVVECRIDLRAGGEFFTLMQGPNGESHPGSGIYLEIISNRRIVWTDLLQQGYRPNPNGFFTGAIELEETSKGTKYAAYALHKDQATKKQHQDMGFEEGWNIALDQLLDFLKRS